jgi:hypothetical protein
MRSPEARAKLAEKHLCRPDDQSEEDVERFWAEEAARREEEVNLC